MKEGPDTAVARSEGAARRRTHVFSVHAGARTVLFAAASNLRKKLRAAGGREYIEAVWGIGFQWKKES